MSHRSKHHLTPRHLLVLVVTFAILALAGSAQEPGKGPDRSKDRAEAFVRRLLQRFDRDGDGRLDATELRGLRDQLRKGRRHRRQEAPGRRRRARDPQPRQPRRDSARPDRQGAGPIPDALRERLLERLKERFPAARERLRLRMEGRRAVDPRRTPSEKTGPRPEERGGLGGEAPKRRLLRRDAAGSEGGLPPRPEGERRRFRRL